MSFLERHIEENKEAEQRMLQRLGASSLSAFVQEVVPSSIAIDRPPRLPAPVDEQRCVALLQEIGAKNKLCKNFIGEGYYGSITPYVIVRNILENPGWYTAYTPYQSEIAQGRLEALLNFQTMCAELSGMEVANASLLDEATAAAEAMTMLWRVRKDAQATARVFLVDESMFDQTIDVLITRAGPLGIEVVVTSLDEHKVGDRGVFGIITQYPNKYGILQDHASLFARAHEHGVRVVTCANLLALTLFRPPGEMGSDVVVGSTQNFGLPMGYGGPHAAYLTTRAAFKRVVPGRMVGVSKDVHGNLAYRLTLQTREQHIRRQHATSNICTAQVLPAMVAGMYGIYHGGEGLKGVASAIHLKTKALRQVLAQLPLQIMTGYFFNTLCIVFTEKQQATREKIKQAFAQVNINLFYAREGNIRLAVDETHTQEDLQAVVEVFCNVFGTAPLSYDEVLSEEVLAIPPVLQRTSAYLQHPTFKKYRTEHEMLRYIKRLENKDISLTHSMIPLGSCTMKLNATAEMLPLSWACFAAIHPFVPASQSMGYEQLMRELGEWLQEITGMAGVSFQPNAGAQGEYAGLLVIRAYFRAIGQAQRDVILIPSSAHGTNPASASMAGMKIVVVPCDQRGYIDLVALKAYGEQCGDRLAGMMITYPSTHGVYEENIEEVCQFIHAQGGQVYMDGANMNAQMGLTSPAKIGVDVCHLNLHKTFCIPHGGGGPGMGPILVGKHLKPYLPTHCVVPSGEKRGIGAVSATPFGSAMLLVIPYAYLRMMGAEGIKKSAERAILHTNYIKARIQNDYPVLYTGSTHKNAHEFIIDCRPFQVANVTVEDIAKRLIDYGFHAPTISFPVVGTMMIEPTESESLEEIDRFCEALLSIRREIAAIINEKKSLHDHVLKNAPHTLSALLKDQWDKPYTRYEAAYPLPYLQKNKYWAPVGRVDNAYGDKNFMCTCPPVEAYQGLNEKLLV